METMKRKTKIYTTIVAVASLLAFVGYFFSLYSNNENHISTFTNLIIVFTCFCGVLTIKQKLENKFLDILVKIDGALFVVFVITVVVKLFI